MTKDQVKALVADIRREYPNPISANTRHDLLECERYCVGGAFCRYLHKRRPDKIGRLFNTACYSNIRFPFAYKIAQIVQDAMPHIPMGTLFPQAEKIPKANDIGNFEEAWKELENLLCLGVSDDDNTANPKD